MGNILNEIIPDPVHVGLDPGLESVLAAGIKGGVHLFQEGIKWGRLLSRRRFLRTEEP